MVCSAGCWGSATVMSKSALQTCAPLPLLVVQLCASVAFLWLVTLLRADRYQLTFGVVRPAMLGVLEPGLAYLFGIFGLERSSASLASLIMGGEPLMVLAVGALLFREKLATSTVRYALLGFVGLVAIVATAHEKTGTTVIGALCVLAGTLCAAFYVVLSSHVSRQFEPLHLAVAQQSVALCFLLVLISFQSSLRGPLADMSSCQLLFAMLSGVVQYGLALWAYLFALQRMSFVRAALFLNLIPLFGVFCAYLFLDEKLLFLQWLGAALVLFALTKTRSA